MKKLSAILAAGALALATVAHAQGGSCAGGFNGARSAAVEPILADVALIYGLDPGLLSAIARAESGECTDAVSARGAEGLMQLMPDTALRFGVGDAFDPVQNALGAARLLDYLRRTRPAERRTLAEILAAYNAGEGAVDRAGGIPDYPETREYIRRVLWLYLLGHVPEAKPNRSIDRKGVARSSAPGARSAPKAHSLNSDAAILEQLSELRQARGQEDIGARRHQE